MGIAGGKGWRIASFVIVLAIFFLTAWQTSAAAQQTLADKLLEIMRANHQITEEQYKELKKQAEEEKAAQAAAVAQQVKTEMQYKEMQEKAEEEKAAQAEAAAKAATPAPGAPSKAAAKPERGTVTIGGTTVTVGGFVEAAGIYRSKNETADVGSNFNTSIPFAYTTGTVSGKTANVTNPNAQQSELRGSARQSRITALAVAKPNENTTVSAYVESDFLGAAPTANSVESNSYNPRLRVAYGTVDLGGSGTHFLAGQEWSLLTTNRVGIIPREENIPLTIDAQYVVGFNWTRNPQLRVVQDFCDQKVWLGLSVESPQTNLDGIAAPSFVSGYNAGGSLLSTSTYSTDIAPDIIGKLAFDPGWGHYELFGITRFFHNYVPGPGSVAVKPPANASFGSNDSVGFGGGAAAILPVIPKMVDLQANFMAGQGIGRYGSAQMPDLTFTPTGDLYLLTGYSAMGGIVGHPVPCLDTYLYGGFEGVERANYTTTSPTSIGYGDFGLLVGQQQTEDVWQITGGVWGHIYQGAFGKVLLGFQYSLTSRDAFTCSTGVGQHAFENIFMTSFRFYPM